jgi:hypothetical protein
MIHQPMGGFQGQASDIEIHAKEILYLKQKLNDMLAKHTGQPIERIERDTDRDNFLSADAAGIRSGRQGIDFSRTRMRLPELKLPPTRRTDSGDIDDGQETGGTKSFFTAPFAARASTRSRS